MRTMNTAGLILDYSLYPRHSVDSQHVSYMVESIKAKVTLPPIVIDKKSKRVVDGFHRVTAFQRIDKDKAKIKVIEKSYKKEADMFLDAIFYNASHGRMLTTYDRTHCILQAEQFKIPDDQLASALQITMEKIGELKADRIAEGVMAVPVTRKVEGKRAASYGKRRIALKQGVSHLSNTTLTKKQVGGMEKFQGLNQLFYVNQIINLIENNLLDKDNSDLIDRLKVLAEMIESL